MTTLVIIDAANVVGSVPDGWWRDRRGAAERLRDRLAVDGVPGHEGPVEIVLVVEGAARGWSPCRGYGWSRRPGVGTTGSPSWRPTPLGGPALLLRLIVNCGAGWVSSGRR